MYILHPRYFEKPNPSVGDIQQCVDTLRREILDALRHKGPEQRVSIQFRHDVYKSLFQGVGKVAQQKHWTLFESADFHRCKLPENWNYLLNQHGDGVRMMFPVKMRTFLGRSPKNYEKEGEQMVEIPRQYVEKISLIFIKVPHCS